MARTIALCFVVGALSAGCSRIETTHSLYEDVRPSARKGPAEVVPGPTTRPYREVAVVRACGNAPIGFLRPKPSSLVSVLRNEAGRVGADAILRPAGGWVREPDGYVRAVAVQWVPMAAGRTAFAVPGARPGLQAPTAYRVFGVPSPTSAQLARAAPSAGAPAPSTAGLDVADDGTAPAVPASEPASGPIESSQQAADGSSKRYSSQQAADGSSKRYVSADGGRTWAPAPSDEQPPPAR